jgi:hypothetical protein
MSYRPGTTAVSTVAEGPGGRRVEVIDFMPWDGSGGIVRLVRALSGPVDVEVEVLAGPERRPGGDRRRVAPTATGLLLDGLSIHAQCRFEPAPLDRDTPLWRGVTRLDVGEEMVVALGFDQPVGPAAAHRMLGDTELAAAGWLGTLVYGGPYRAEVGRALLGLKMLTGTGGAPAAAGTTSLPRRLGSERSTDARWVSLYDAAASVPALAVAGLAEDAEAAEAWLRTTVETAHLPWPAWFDRDGQPVPEPEEWPVRGWRGAQPVRAGRFQPAPDPGLIGPLALAVGASMKGPGGRPDDPGPLSAAFGPLADATDRAGDHWREPDGGRWEIERPLRLYVAGRVWLWVGLDRMARLARAANPLDLRAAGWQQEGRRILSWLESEAVAADGGLRMDTSSDEADAALLAAAWTGPWPLGHPVVGATVDRVLERLSSGPLVHRYSDRVADERAGPDHPDLEASLLAVRALASLGRWEEAHERMEGVASLARRAGPGLLSETADPVSGQLYGNFPSSGAALALVNAAFALEGGPR